MRITKTDELYGTLYEIYKRDCGMPGTPMNVTYLGEVYMFMEDSGEWFFVKKGNGGNTLDERYSSASVKF